MAQQRSATLSDCQLHKSPNHSREFGMRRRQCHIDVDKIADMSVDKETAELLKDVATILNQLHTGGADAQHYLARLTTLYPFKNQDQLLLKQDMRVSEFYAELEAKILAQVKPWYMIDPDSTFRRLWDFVALVGLLEMVISIPMFIAFYLESETCDYFTPATYTPNLADDSAHQFPTSWGIVGAFVNVFFLVDILLSFLTGIKIGPGETNYDIKYVSISYLKSFFIADIVAFFPLECVFTSALPGVETYNSGKLVRLLRLVGLGRRLPSSPFKLLDYFWKDSLVNLSHVLRQLISNSLAFLVVIHFWACVLWVSIRAQGFPSEPQETWPVYLDIQGMNAPVIVQWLFSYMSIVAGAIGLGFGPSNPVTYPEAIVWIFSMLTTAGFFAIINGYVFRYIFIVTGEEQEYKLLVDNISSILQRRGASSAVTKQVLNYFESRHNQEGIGSSTELLDKVPLVLRRDVALQAVGPILNNGIFSTDFPDLKNDLAPLLRADAAAPGQKIIMQGDRTHFIYVVNSGFVKILVDGVITDLLSTGDVFGTHALLPPLGEASAPFPAPFTAIAQTNCSLYYLNVEDFYNLLRVYPEAKGQLQRVAEEYGRRCEDYLRAQANSFASEEKSVDEKV